LHNTNKGVRVLGEPVVVTGSSGLIGRAVIRRMAAAGLYPARFDIRESDVAARADLRDEDALQRALAEAAGVIHLGAVSRVIWGEHSPEACWTVNVEATRALLNIALECPRRPWVVYASSREVYGQQDSLPVPETAALKPLNVYARSKLAAENLVWQAREAGLRAAVVRFSSVYGDTEDHIDRVVPAFASAAAHGGVMRIDGSDCGLDFTHVSDVAAGVLEICRVLSAGERSLPPLHFVSGVCTTLRELSEMAVAAGSRRVKMIEAPSRSFDVSNFWGDPSRTAAILGWRSTIPIRRGIGRLVAEFAANPPTQVGHVPMAAMRTAPL
jgi:nucleoside-diphosphate-sugar epimerase